MSARLLTMVFAAMLGACGGGDAIDPAADCASNAGAPHPDREDPQWRLRCPAGVS